MNDESKKSEAEELLDDLESKTEQAAEPQPGSEDVAADSSDAGQAIESIIGEIEAADDSQQQQHGEPSTEEQLAVANDNILKLHAELDNVRKRVRREADEQIKYASLPLLADLLQVHDNLRRALEAAAGSEDASGLVEGVKMVSKQFEDTLGKFNCKPIPAIGELFDPNFHEAISQMPSDDIAQGNVMLEATQGFQLHDRVVRPSQVVVSTGKAT